MTSIARQLSATQLGPGRWRVQLAFKGTPTEPESLPRPHPRAVALRGDPAGAKVESLAIPMPTAPQRFSIVLAVPEQTAAGAPRRFELGGPGWTAEIELPRAGQPPSSDVSRPAAIDYTARDFDVLRTMLQAVADERAGMGLADHPVSQTGALIEQLAYLGDALSYSQDGVATEAYLASARRRISVSRHAELLDYVVGTAQSARVWVRFKAAAQITLPARTQLLAGAAALPVLVPADALPAALAAGALVFETLDEVTLEPDRAPYQLASMQHAAARLAPGATSATVAGSGTGLHAGQLILIEPVDPLSTPAGQVVRLTQVSDAAQDTIVEWGQADALVGDEALTQTAVQLRVGNLVLAEQAQTHDWAVLPRPVSGVAYWPELPFLRPAFTAPAPAGGNGTGASATDMLNATGAQIQAAVEVRAGPEGYFRPWSVRQSLLDSGPFDPAFVVEVEDDGTARLRFGDGTNGMRPPVGATFEAMVRSGGGSAGNVGIGAIAHIVGIGQPQLRVRNPVSAVGGADPEPLANVRLHAPTAFRSTDRAVTADQYSAAALEVDGVADATTIIVPTGTGPLARVRIFAGDWTTPVQPLVAQVADALGRVRPVGVSVDVGGAIAMPVTIELDVTADPDWSLAAIASSIEKTLNARLVGPGQFGFATILYRSEVLTWLMPLAGVIDATLTRFRFTEDAADAPAVDELVPPFGHIIRIDNDPSAAEMGSVSFRLRTEPT
jgi:hypothetical protein